MSSPVCEVAAFGKNALNESVNVIVAAAALENLKISNDIIKSYFCYDLTDFFKALAWLVVLCFVQEWFLVVIKFITKTIPRFFKNLLCGRLNLCLLDLFCEEPKPKSSKSSKSSKSTCTKSSRSSSSSSSSSLF